MNILNLGLVLVLVIIYHFLLNFLHLYLPKLNDYGLNFRKLNYPAMLESLSRIDWIQLFDGDHDINYMFDIFYKTLYGICDIYVSKHKPNKKVNIYPKHIVKLNENVSNYSKRDLIHIIILFPGIVLNNHFMNKPIN